MSGSRAATSKGNAIAVIGAITASSGISSAARDRTSASVMANHVKASSARASKRQAANNVRASNAKPNHVKGSSASPNNAKGSNANPNNVKANALSRSRACSRSAVGRRAPMAAVSRTPSGGAAAAIDAIEVIAASAEIAANVASA